MTTHGVRMTTTGVLWELIMDNKNRRPCLLFNTTNEVTYILLVFRCTAAAAAGAVVDKKDAKHKNMFHAVCGLLLR